MKGAEPSGLKRWLKYSLLVLGSLVSLFLMLVAIVLFTFDNEDYRRLTTRAVRIFTGHTVPGESLFPGWEDILCRNKLAIKTDARTLFESVDWDTFGNHRVAFYGDYRQEFKDLAKLIGFEAVEKDR